MNLVINSQFRPFTYDEMVKPLVQYKEAYDKVEEDYSNLITQTEMWKDIANRENNPVAYEMYNRYSNDLAAITEDFSRGMNINNRRALLGMKRRYYEDIQPIANASKKIEELSAEQRKLAASNPNLMFDRDFSSEVSIDQMMENPNMSYRAIDGNDFYAKGAAITKAMSSRLNTINPALRGQYWEIKKGFGEEAANQFLLDSNAIPELNEALNDLVSTADVPDNLKSRVFEYAKQGAISGMVGETSYQANRGYESPAGYAKRKLATEQFNIQMGKIPYRTDPDGTKYYVNTAANSTWKITSDNKVTEHKPAGGKKGTITKDALVPHEVLADEGFYKNSLTGNVYKQEADGSFTRYTESDLKAYGVNSRRRVQNYLNSRGQLPEDRKYEIGVFEVKGDETLKALSREKNIDTYNDMYNKLNDNKLSSVDGWEYFNGNINSESAKAIKSVLIEKGLNLEDIEILSDNNGGLFSNEKILVRVKKYGNKSSNSNSVNRSNTLVKTH